MNLFIYIYMYIYIYIYIYIYLFIYLYIYIYTYIHPFSIDSFTPTVFPYRRNQYVRMSFLGLFQFRAPYLPWVLLGFSVRHGLTRDIYIYMYICIDIDIDIDTDIDIDI